MRTKQCCLLFLQYFGHYFADHNFSDCIWEIWSSDYLGHKLCLSPKRKAYDFGQTCAQVKAWQK